MLMLASVLMTDPAIAYIPDEGYGPFDRGTAADIWLKAANNSSPFLGAVWPGVTVFPDWFNSKTQECVLFYKFRTRIRLIMLRQLLEQRVRALLRPGLWPGH